MGIIPPFLIWNGVGVGIGGGVGLGGLIPMKIPPFFALQSIVILAAEEWHGQNPTVLDISV